MANRIVAVPYESLNINGHFQELRVPVIKLRPAEARILAQGIEVLAKECGKDDLITLSALSTSACPGILAEKTIAVTTENSGTSS